MKKRKTYEISVIDKTYSKIVSDETKFYTSDTELWLGFELSEENVEFDSAEILMFNINDKSFVVRSVVKTDDKYWYELDMDMIAHHGEWKVQLQFTKDSEVYTSKHINFRIENDLSNERPPKLIDITNWSNIKQTADSLIAEMKVAVTEAIKTEQNRAEAFAQAESERQTAFEANESERTETFNTNEATRQENEEARELAENERENGEAQRKIDHANRSAELAGKANKIQEDWITPTLLNGWKNVDEAQPLRFMKDEFGFVHIQGRIRNGEVRKHAFTLPLGYGSSRNVYGLFPNGGSSNTFTKGIVDTYRRLVLYNDNNDTQVDISFKAGD